MKSCTDLFSFNEMNQVSLVTTTTNAPPTTHTSTVSADVSTMDCLDDRQATPTDTDQRGGVGSAHGTTCTPSQIETASEGTDTDVNVDTSGDSLLLGELVVGEELTEGGGGSGERKEGEKGGGGGGESGEGGIDGREEKVKERRKPPVTKRYMYCDSVRFF